MTNQETNKKFLSITDAGTRDEVLLAIANHYGITKAEALEEVTQDEAEHLLDYLTETHRTAIHVLMSRHGLATN
ncbi:MAG: hypothetical protein Q7U16_10200 [Agitococcus sp.]|nr:hypothetical protein [Agitococcus sp.]